MNALANVFFIIFLFKKKWLKKFTKFLTEKRILCKSKTNTKEMKKKMEWENDCLELEINYFELSIRWVFISLNSSWMERQFCLESFCFGKYHAENAFENDCWLYNHWPNAPTRSLSRMVLKKFNGRKVEAHAERERGREIEINAKKSCWKTIKTHDWCGGYGQIYFAFVVFTTTAPVNPSVLLAVQAHLSHTFSLSAINTIIWMVLFFTTCFFCLAFPSFVLRPSTFTV